MLADSGHRSAMCFSCVQHYCEFEVIFLVVQAGEIETSMVQTNIFARVCKPTESMNAFLKPSNVFRYMGYVLPKCANFTADSSGLHRRRSFYSFPN